MIYELRMDTQKRTRAKYCTSIHHHRVWIRNLLGAKECLWFIASSATTINISHMRARGECPLVCCKPNIHKYLGKSEWYASERGQRRPYQCAENQIFELWTRCGDKCLRAYSTCVKTGASKWRMHSRMCMVFGWVCERDVECRRRAQCRKWK